MLNLRWTLWLKLCVFCAWGFGHADKDVLTRAVADVLPVVGLVTFELWAAVNKMSSLKNSLWNTIGLFVERVRLYGPPYVNAAQRVLAFPVGMERTRNVTTFTRDVVVNVVSDLSQTCLLLGNSFVTVWFCCGKCIWKVPGTVWRKQVPRLT